MAEKHVVELLIESSKHISNLITKMQNDPSQTNDSIIDNINDVIRELDNIVEYLEKR
jgi:hypothetical protein